MWKKFFDFINSPGLNSFITLLSNFWTYILNSILAVLAFNSFSEGWGIVFSISSVILLISSAIVAIQKWQKRKRETRNPPPPEPPKTFLPPYLFYLPNRKDQRDKLSKAINEHEHTGSKQRPLVCLVGGESQEAHDKFKDCFVNKTLPKLYDWISDENDVKCFELTMCNCRPDCNELQDDILNRLIDKLSHYPPENTKAGVTQFLAEQGQPVIVYIDISIEDCQPVNDIIEKGFIEFWRDWPVPQADYFINQEDNAHYRLLVFMCFHYPDTTRFKFTNPLSQPSRIRRKVTRQLNRLDKHLSKSIYWFQVGTVVLPQLESIKKEAAIEWLRDECKNHITSSYDTLKTLEEKIRQFYQGHSHGIPMEILASQLQKILQESTT
ncbi:MAG TPA: hypothetical protein EYP59_12120 [Thiotrichaceae bacterium]|nr:hypothetical protein [Thiotrichaceae bacterium]